MYVVFLSGIEFGSEPKSGSLSTQSELVTHLHIETHLKNPLKRSFKKRLKKEPLVSKGVRDNTGYRSVFVFC